MWRVNDSITAIITALYGISGRRIWVKLWGKLMPIYEIDFAVSCSTTVTNEFELQLIDENGWQSTKLNDNVSKFIYQRRNRNEHSHIPECPGRNWKHFFFMKRWRKWAGKPILDVSFQISLFVSYNHIHKSIALACIYRL